MKRHNPGLSTELWRIHDARPVEGKGLRLVLGVDVASAEKLKGLGYRAKAGVERVSFWDPKPAVAASGEPEEAPVEGSPSDAIEVVATEQKKAN